MHDPRMGSRLERIERRNETNTRRRKRNLEKIRKLSTEKELPSCFSYSSHQPFLAGNSKKKFHFFPPTGERIATNIFFSFPSPWVSSSILPTFSIYETFQQLRFRKTINHLVLHRSFLFCVSFVYKNKGLEKAHVDHGSAMERRNKLWSATGGSIIWRRSAAAGNWTKKSINIIK